MLGLPHTVQVIVEGEEACEALVKLLDVEVGIEPVGVGCGGAKLAQLVLGDDVEPAHLLVHAHRKGGADVLTWHRRKGKERKGEGRRGKEREGQGRAGK